MNGDRNFQNNMLVSPLTSDHQKVKIFAIDDGFCFGNPDWEMSLINQVDAWPNNLSEVLFHYIQGKNPFGIALEKLKNISDIQFDEVVNEIPSVEWGISREEIEILRSF